MCKTHHLIVAVRKKEQEIWSTKITTENREKKNSISRCYLITSRKWLMNYCGYPVSNKFALFTQNWRIGDLNKIKFKRCKSIPFSSNVGT